MTFSTIGKVLGSATVASLLLAGAASAQTTGTTDTSSTAGTYTTTDASGTTGVPNTGAGGDMAMNLALMGGSLVAAAAGAVYVARKRIV